MDGAEKLRRDTIPFVPRAQSAGTEPPLQIAMNPFVAGMSGSRMGRPLQTAFGEVIRQIGEQTPVVVVVGSAGTGKSMLVEMAARACVGMGLSVRRAERGDLVQSTFGEKSDVLLVDQTDSISNASLQTLLSANGKNIATTMVFLCLPSCVSRFSFSGTQAAVVELTPLSLSDARNYLQERATSIGRSNLFAPEALDIVIDGSRGLPRLLRSIAQLAFFAAASEGASQISPNHVSNALASQATLDGQNADPEVSEHARQAEPARVNLLRAADPPAPRVAPENPEAEIVRAKRAEIESRVHANRIAEPSIPRPTQETQNQNSIADIAAHVRFATQKREVASAPQVSAKAITETSSVRVAPVVPVMTVPTPAAPVAPMAAAPVPAAPVAPMAAAPVPAAPVAPMAAAPIPAAPVAPMVAAPVRAAPGAPTAAPSVAAQQAPVLSPTLRASELSSPASLRASVQPPKSMAAARSEVVSPREGQWISRSVGIAGGLAACFAVAAVISFNLMSSGPDTAKPASAVLAIAKPADISKAVVQAPVSETQTVSAALPAPITNRAQARDEAIANLIAKVPATSPPAGTSAEAAAQQAKPEAVARTPAATPAITNQQARANRVAEEAAARRLAEDKARAEREAADRVQQAQRAAEAAAQLAAAQAEERAASDRAMAAERAVQEKAAQEKAVADRAKAAELAAVQAQETAKVALEQEAARRAKAAKDAADKAAKDAADRERAEKMAAEAAKAAQRESNRVFSHSLFGFNR